MDIDFCVTTSATWQLVGYFLFALKVVIPVVIIILGIMDFVNALIAKEDSGISKATKSLIVRFVMGIAIFFVPLIISVGFHLVASASTFLQKADTCQTCLLQPFNSSCEAAKATAKKALAAEKEEALNDRQSFGSKVEGCYKCNGKYVWTDEKCGTKVISLDGVYTKKTCEAENNNPANKVEQSLIERPSTGESSKITDVIYLGDSIMNGVCIYKNLDKSSGCYYGVGKSIEWLKGNSTQMGSGINSANPVSEITTIIKNNSKKKYGIVILMGVNDLSGGGNPKTIANSYASFYSKLAQGDWKNAILKIVSINPVGSNVARYGYNATYLSNARINSFNSELSKAIGNLRLANVKFCSTGIKQSELDYFDDLHFGNNGRAKLYNAIQENCLK